MPEELDPEWEYWMPSMEWLEAMEGVGRYEGGPVDMVYDTFDAQESSDRGESVGFRFGKGNPDGFIGRLARPRPMTEQEYRESSRRGGYLRYCLGCGDPFTYNHPTHRFCSKRCAGRMIRGGWGTSRFARPILMKQCRWCEGAFQTRQPDRKFCAKGCRAMWQRAHPELISSDLGRPTILLAVLTLTCPNCEVVFQTKDASRVYCSRKCSNTRRDDNRPRPGRVIGSDGGGGVSKRAGRRLRGAVGNYRWNVSSKPDHPFFQEVVRLYLEGKLVWEIEVKLNTSPVTVTKILRQAGLR